MQKSKSLKRLICWSSRRTKLSWSEIIVVLSFIVMYISQIAFCIEEFTSLESDKKQELLKTLWDQMTEHELHYIFGKSSNQKEDVPKHLDIISKPLITSHRKIKRRKRSAGNNQQQQVQDPEAELSKSIKMSGLGRDFVLNLVPNLNLIHQDDFVHLIRYQNYSNILPDGFVRGRLNCFFHGNVQNSKSGQEISTSNIKYGRAALNLCKGVAGYIIPSDNDPEHFYVIHPVPIRLQQQQVQQEDHSSSSDDTDEAENMFHFIWRKHPNEIVNSLMSPFKDTKVVNNHNQVHYHYHGSGQKENVTSGTGEQDIISSTGSRIVASSTSPNDTYGGSIACTHEFQLYDSVDSRQNDKQTMKHAQMNENGDGGMHKKMKKNPTKMMMMVKKPSRAKRSPSSTYLDDGHFHYKPLNIASDSYWLRYRTSSTTTVSPTVNKRTSVTLTGSNMNPWTRLTTNTRRYDDLVDDDGASSVEFKPSSSSSSDGHDWAKGVLVYESSPSLISEQYVPFPSTSFYTSTTTRKDSIFRDDETDETDGIAKRTRWITSNQRAIPVPNNNDTSNYYKNSWVLSSSLSGPLSFPVRTRKGRRDDSIFGEKWYSPLDYTGSSTSNLGTDSRNDPMVSSESSVFPTNTDEKKQFGLSSTSTYKEPSHLTIETAVFIDKDLYKHMQTNFPEDTHGEVARIVLTMINAVQLLYQDPSLGHRVDFVLKRLEILESDPVGLLRPLDIDKFLTNFCKWQKIENPPNDAHFLHWDHALILTGLDLYVVHQSGKISNQVVGLAPVSGMCTRSSSCTVNEGRHFESVYVVAHEIGHNLGMRHDGPAADNDCDPTSHIMSPTLGSGKISWSPCSRRYLDMFLETPQSKCLLDKAKAESRLDHESDGRLPGERFDADKQCVLKYGRGSYHADQQPIEDVCRDLHCRKEHYTWTSHPALEGTFCGLEMWCRAGKCVPKMRNLLSSTEQNIGGSFFSNNHLDKSETAQYSAARPIDGGWSKWSPYTECSSACLYSDDKLGLSSVGVRLAARRCDSPRPENGGLQCIGLDRRYKTCAAEQVCPFESSKTSITQYANEVCTRAAKVDTELSGRGFMTNTNDPERACSVWCETLQRTGSRSRGWSFPDGTHCSLSGIPSGSASSYCIAGKCQDFTCDPLSHFIQADEICHTKTISFSDGKLTNRNNEHEHRVPKTWFHTSSSSSSVSSSVSSSSGSRLIKNFNNNGHGHENEVYGWTKWEAHSDCKLSCIAPAKGLELVQRHCRSGDHCSGVALSVRLCKPNKTTIMANGCTRLQTPFEYATKICSKYSSKVNGLSGIGMQLSPTKDDIDRPCHIGCQDSNLPYRFYMVNGEEGWFPSGTDCSRGEPNKKAYCLSGKCIEFDDDDTPVYRMNARLLGGFDTVFRSKRESSHLTSYNLSYPSRSTYKQLNIRRDSDELLGESSLRSLVEKFSASYSLTSKRNDLGALPKLDFSRPVELHARNIQNLEMSLNSSFMSNPHEDLDLTPSAGSESQMVLEGSFFEWRKIMSDCSVICGDGIQEVIVQCISGETVVSDSLCPKETRPGTSGYLPCTAQRTCPSNSLSQYSISNSLFWHWLDSFRDASRIHNSTNSQLRRHF